MLFFYNKQKFTYPLILFLISLFHSLFYIYMFDNPLYADAAQYDNLALNINKGFFSIDPDNPTKIDMLREPLYPIFLSLIYKIFGHNYYYVYFVQAILFSLTCIITYYLCNEIFSKKYSILSSFLLAILPTLANYPSYILTECFFTFLLTLYIYISTLSFKYNNLFLYLLSGFILSLICLTKSIGLLIIFFIPFLIIIYYRKITKKLLINFFLLFFIFILTLSPWSYRNYSNFGTIQISLRGADALWMASSTLDYDRNQILQNIVFNFSEYLGNKTFPGLVQKPRDFILLRNNEYENRQNELREAGITSPSKIDKIMRTEAIEKILDKPFIYLAQRFLEFEKMLSFNYVPILNQFNTQNYFNEKFSPNGSLYLSLIKAPFKILGYLIFLLSIYGIFLTIKNYSKFIFLLFIILYINIFYSLLFSVGRYAVPLIPFYLIFCTIAIEHINKLFIKR